MAFLSDEVKELINKQAESDPCLQSCEEPPRQYYEMGIRNGILLAYYNMLELLHPDAPERANFMLPPELVVEIDQMLKHDAGCECNFHRRVDAIKKYQAEMKAKTLVTLRSE